MGNVAIDVLGFPGEAFAHGLDGHKLGKFFQHGAFARAPGTFDELNDAGPHAVADVAEHHAEGGGGFALALAGVDDEQAALNGLARHDLVAGGFLLGHLVVMPCGIYFFGHC